MIHCTWELLVPAVGKWPCFPGHHFKDNCHLGGKTLDFGPFGFMEKYNPRYCTWLQKKKQYGVTQFFFIYYYYSTYYYITYYIIRYVSLKNRDDEKRDSEVLHSCQHSRLFRLSACKKASQVVGPVVQRILVFTCSRKQHWPILEVLFDPCPHFGQPYSWFPFHNDL